MSLEFQLPFGPYVTDVLQRLLRVTAQQDLLQAAATMCSYHDEIAAPRLFSLFNDHFVRTALVTQTVRALHTRRFCSFLNSAQYLVVRYVWCDSRPRVGHVSRLTNILRTAER